MSFLSPAVRMKVSVAMRAMAAPVVMGRLVRVTGMILEASIPGASIGDFIEIGDGEHNLRAAVVGFRDGVALAVPYGGVEGLAPGVRVVRRGAAGIPVSAALIGRVIDPFGAPLDGGPEIVGVEIPVDAPAPPALRRAAITEPVETGVRAIDSLLTLGRGQRVGIFAGAGVGKTQLIRQIANQSKSDVVVFGLIGERGCEVRDLLDDEVSARSVLVVSTSDRSPLERARGALAATAVAEHFRDRGMDVLLIIDSLTRYAMSLREIGLAAGEPPTTKGYPPSVFATLPRLLERVAPLRGGGSITGVYTVLVEGDDLSDPVADSARSLLDGHIVLSREMAGRGHFPAIDVIASNSRVARQVTSPEVQAISQRARTALAARREVEDLRSLGAYTVGQNPANDETLATGFRLDSWSRQRQEERSGAGESIAALAAALDKRKGDR